MCIRDREKATLKEISELLGKETIDSVKQSENRGSQVSHGPVSYTHLDVYKRQEYGMTPSDIIEELPYIFKTITE